MNCTDTIIPVYKEREITSFESLRVIRRLINRKTGHCGTLDRFAEGLLIVCCGRFTRKVPLFMNLGKTYRAVIEFGRETDTLDPDGKTLRVSAVPDFSVIESAVLQLKGKIMQVPPRYSALHIDGKRSYQLARKGIEVEPEPRQVEISGAVINSWNAPFLDITLEVSKGTYIRSYARDLAALCGSAAFVSSLKRLQIGPFRAEDAVLWNDEHALAQYDVDRAEAFLSRLEQYGKEQRG